MSEIKFVGGADSNISGGRDFVDNYAKSLKDTETNVAEHLRTIDNLGSKIQESEESLAKYSALLLKQQEDKIRYDELIVSYEEELEEASAEERPDIERSLQDVRALIELTEKLSGICKEVVNNEHESVQKNKEKRDRIAALVSEIKKLKDRLDNRIESTFEEQAYPNPQAKSN